MEKSESEIVVSCQKGRLEDFALLYDRYNRKIYDFIYFRTHHKETAEDLTSLSFTKAFENLQKFNPAKAKFSTWLYQIARNTVIDHFRTFKSTTPIEDAWEVPSGGNIQKDLDTAANLEKVSRYLQTLPAAHRDVVIMRVWDGLSYKEIAEILNVSEASAKMSFSRAVAKMNKEIVVALAAILILMN